MANELLKIRCILFRGNYHMIKADPPGHGMQVDLSCTHPRL